MADSDRDPRTEDHFEETGLRQEVDPYITEAWERKSYALCMPLGIVKAELVMGPAGL